MKVIYQGIPQEQQDAYVAAQMKGKDAPEKTAQESYYHIASRDDAIQQQVKLKRTAEWMAEREAEHRQETQAHDAEYFVLGMKFPKGEVVDIPEKHALLTVTVDTKEGKKQVPGRMHKLIEDGRFVKAEDVEQEEHTEEHSLATDGPVEPSEHEKRRPGRPRKAE